MSVSLEKIDGVQSVAVTLNDGHARLVLKPGNKVTLDQVRRVVERNGFTPKGAAVVAEADVIAGPGAQLRLQVSGTNETFPLATVTTEAVRAELKKQVGKQVVVQGIVAALKENAAWPIDVKDVKPSTR